MNSAVRQHTALPAAQRGAVVLLLLLILAVSTASYFLVKRLNGNALNIERDKITAAALAQAKAALIGRAASVDLSSGVCGNNCARPGELPCPDNWPQGSPNEGTPKTPCNGNAIGRLPWKSLGLPDLRDGAGERLWYAVSVNYKNSTRIFPLNSDTLGTISIKDPNGNLLADAASGKGVAAIVISPGSALTRQDGIIQNRDTSGYNNPVNYLDVANGEDNQDFINGLNNGFIQGPIKNMNNSLVLNDVLITLSRDDIMRAAEKRVAAEITNALSLLGSLPAPAAFNDTTCLGSAAIPSNCNSAAVGNRGRIPANPPSAWIGDAVLLNGVRDNHWFQQNAWREVIFYTTGSLTLNNPPAAAITNRQTLIIMTGYALPGQNRGSTTQQGIEANYLEEENSTPLDDTYTLRPTSAITPFNDKIRCLPSSSNQC